MSEHKLFTTADVQARYRLADVRSARRLMHEAGGFRLAGRLYVRLEHLIEHEDALRQRATEPPAPVPIVQARRRRSPGATADLAPYWWRESNPREPA